MHYGKLKKKKRVTCHMKKRPSKNGGRRSVFIDDMYKSHKNGNHLSTSTNDIFFCPKSWKFV